MSDDSQSWVVAFYGPGAINGEAVDGLLIDWLPEDALMLLPTDSPPKTGIRNVREWADEVSQDYQLVTCDDIIPDLIAYRDGGREVYLVLLWGAEGDKKSETLLSDARGKNIPVKDLTQALDDLIIEEAQATEEVEEEPTPPAPEAAPVAVPVVTADLHLGLPLNYDLSTGSKLAEAFYNYVVTIVDQVLDQRDKDAEEEKLSKTPVPLWKDTVTGKYQKPGRGRLRKTQERVEVSRQEARELGLLD